MQGLLGVLTELSTFAAMLCMYQSIAACMQEMKSQPQCRDTGRWHTWDAGGNSCPPFDNDEVLKLRNWRHVVRGAAHTWALIFTVATGHWLLLRQSRLKKTSDDVKYTWE